MVKILAASEAQVERLHTRLGIESYLSLPSDDGDIVIRWGNSSGSFNKAVNPAKAIRLNCQKYDALVMMSQQGVPTPRIYRGSVPRDVKVVIRPLTHSEGSGFRIMTGPVDLDTAHYATKFIETDTEYRVWFAWDHTLMGKRVPISDEQRGQMNPCRSRWGYSFAGEASSALREIIKKARAAIGLEIGAADVLLKDGQYVVLELNSGPTVDDSRIAEFYKAALAEGVRRKYGVALNWAPPRPPTPTPVPGSERVSADVISELRNVRAAIDRLFVRLRDSGVPV